MTQERKSISTLSKEIHENAKAKGFWDKERNLGEMLMLIVSEIAEAMEADRESNFYNAETRYRRWDSVNDNLRAKWAWDVVEHNQDAWVNWFRSEVKNTFEDELADTCIRIFDLAYARGIDLQWHIEQKMRYNTTREHMHGKKY
jgi:NTP pyrophosphatase (non-canonical NTP hydrolase)